MSENVARERLISLLVEDHPGVLNRVSGLIRRRGFSIGSVSAAPSERAGMSRITLTVHAGFAEVDQVEKQLDRLIEVVEVDDLTESESMHRELVMGRVDNGGRNELERRGAHVIHSNGRGIVFEYSGDVDDVDRLIDSMRGHGLRELARSGPVAVRR